MGGVNCFLSKLSLLWKKGKFDQLEQMCYVHLLGGHFSLMVRIQVISSQLIKNTHDQGMFVYKCHLIRKACGEQIFQDLSTLAIKKEFLLHFGLDCD